MEKGYERGKSWMLISNCWYERGQEEKRPECSGRDVKNADADPKLVFNDRALNGFRKVPVTSKQYSDAQKWVDYVTTENNSYEHRCREIWDIGIDDCLFRIHTSVKLQIIRREFRLNKEHEHCLDHMDEYERRYGKITPIE